MLEVDSRDPGAAASIPRGDSNGALWSVARRGCTSIVWLAARTKTASRRIAAGGVCWRAGFLTHEGAVESVLRQAVCDDQACRPDFEYRQGREMVGVRDAQYATLGRAQKVEQPTQEE